MRDDEGVRFLLGRVTDAERDRIERELFTEGDAFDAMLAAEEELFVDYTAGTLGTDDRRRFESRFLATDAGRRRLESTGAALGVLRRTAPAVVAAPRRRTLDSPLTQWALVAAAVVLLATAVWMSRELGRARADAEAARTEASSAKIQAQNAIREASRSAPPPLMVSLMLKPGATRSSGAVRRIALPADAVTLRLQLESDRATTAADGVVVRDVNGTEVWSQPLAPAPAGIVTVDVPAKLLAVDDYEVSIERRGRTPSVYTFGVGRR